MGYHKRRKKSARSFFYRHKRHQSGQNKENDPPESISRHPDLPAHWQLAIANGDTSQYYKLGADAISGLCMVTASVAVNSDGTWNAYFNSKKIPVTCSILSEFPPKVTSQRRLSEIIAVLDRAVLCPGNSEEVFVDIYRKKGGMVKGNRL